MMKRSSQVGPTKTPTNGKQGQSDRDRDSRDRRHSPNRMAPAEGDSGDVNPHIYYEGEQLKDQLQIIPAAVGSGQRFVSSRDRGDGCEHVG